MRTFGCQMNEHDSERIAGLLDADGLVAAGDLDDADVVVLNTCCIRENADNKLYGNLGHLKGWKAARDGRQIVVAGCLAQKDRDEVRRRAGHVDVVMGTHNVHRAAELLREAAVDGPLTEILEAAVLDDHAMFPSALPGRARDVVQRLGDDPDRLRQHVRLLHRARRARRRDVAPVRRHRRRGPRRWPPAGVTEVTLLGQNVNSYGRDLQLAARRDGDAGARVRPLFADLLRAVGAVDGIRRVRFTSPHPKDMRPETFAAMAETPAVCPQLHYPLQAGSDRVLAAMHRGYTADRYLAPARRGPPHRARPRRVHRHHRRVPRRDRRRLRPHPGGRRRGPLRRRLHVHLLAPPGHRGGGDGGPLRRPGRRRRAVPTPARRHRAQRPGRQRGPRRPVEEVLVEGPSKKDADGPRRADGPTPPRPLQRRRARCGPARTPTSRSPAPRRTTSSVASSSSPPSRPTACASRSPPAEMTAPAVVVLGPTASGKSDVAMAAALAVPGTEIVAVDAMQVYRGMDIGTAKPSRRRPARRAAPRHRPRRSRRRLHRRRLPAGRTTLRWPRSPAGRCSSPAPASTSAP